MKPERNCLPINGFLSARTVLKCLPLTVFCLLLPVFSAIGSADHDFSSDFFFSSSDFFITVPDIEDFSHPVLSEKDFPDEEGIRFELIVPTRAAGKPNPLEPHLRKLQYHALFREAFRNEFLPSESCSKEQQFAFQTIQSATLPVRAGPSA